MLRAAGRDVRDLVEEHRSALEARDGLREAVVLRVGAQAVEDLALRGEGWRGQSRKDTEKFRLVLVGVAGSKRHGDHAAQGARPERVHERRQPIDEDHRVRTRTCAGVLKVAQDAERPAAQLAVADAALARLPGDVMNAARARRDRVERLA